MKKLLAFALAIVMMMAIALPAFAAVATENTDEQVERYGKDNDDSSKANYTDDAVDQTSKDTEIRYGVAQAYTVTIPANFELHQLIAAADGRKVGMVYGTQPVSVEDVVIAKGEQLVIRLTSAATDTDAYAWKLIDTETNNKSGDPKTAANSDYVNYVIKVAQTAADTNYADDLIDYSALTSTDGYLAEGGIVLTCAAKQGNIDTTGSNAAVQLYFSSNGTAQEGTYLDTLTFTTSIEVA